MTTGGACGHLPALVKFSGFSFVGGTRSWGIQFGWMDKVLKIIGKGLRRFIATAKRPMGWGVIDAFARLEEREGPRPAAAGNEQAHDPPSPQNPDEDR